jgi:hypothetical protein
MVMATAVDAKSMVCGFFIFLYSDRELVAGLR